MQWVERQVAVDGVTNLQAEELQEDEEEDGNRILQPVQALRRQEEKNLHS
jgi:hypothetical protein